MSNLETIQQIYEAFGRGDIPAILERLAEDIRWEHHPTGNAAQDQDVPYMRSRSGREAVAGFFQDIQEDFEMNSFNPHSFLEGNGRVAVVIEVDLTVKSTGKRLQDEEIHLWEFGSDGKVVSHRHFLDTGKAIEAHS
jgi:ketosteroid isomerase-like protein